ncbi:DUF3040 domain-containing protein [Arthrobacter sp. H35-D1]|uniref:DUF3040 domain-containing protein n=1 Tax=Arthrobacter sp. H35-D1 TaxID=3046202 RepID=UPI0024BAEBE1|nr:DUF3040 domain-containing protein [Arthrobacter sp. H35-D1]MDJ0313580.1 DUF3040 domain-containing protein [Arthrobacter sp. H35-D1]
MSLSEHEKRVLDELGRQLDAEDPKFARSLGPRPVHARPTRRMSWGVLLALAGVVLLLFGVGLEAVPLGVAGFLIMIGGAYYAGSTGKPSAGTVPQGRFFTAFSNVRKGHRDKKRQDH